MDIDHAVIWVENAQRSLEFYVNTLGFEAVRGEEFSQGKARFPSVRINDKTIFDIMEYDALLPLVQKFTGGGEGIGGAPINHICLSMEHEEYNAIIARLEESGVKLTSGGENAFGAQGQAVRSTYFNDPDGNVLEIRFYDI
ncbi:MAG: VOC family protein [Pseudomonadales bacterium]|nr:VOC family protein [Pseudomonadales bacterium]